MRRPYSGKYYKQIQIPEHPLAKSNGMVSLHRAVLFAKIGPGSPHSCHWCGKNVYWIKADVGFDGSSYLVVDHLDGDKTNNQPGNLVPSCNGCNSLRQRGWRIQEGELFIIDHRGDRMRAVETECLYCHKKIIDIPAKKRKFCSRSCVRRWHHGLSVTPSRAG